MRFFGAKIGFALGCGISLLSQIVQAQTPPYQDTAPIVRSKTIRIGGFPVNAPGGIAFVVNDAAAFVVDTGIPPSTEIASPDDSFHEVKFRAQDAQITFDWGRVGDAVVARLTSDKPVMLPLHLSAGRQGFVSRFTATPNGVTGQATALGRPVIWRLVTLPRPVQASDQAVTVSVTPGAPLRFVAGFGQLPMFSQVQKALTQAQKQSSGSKTSAQPTPVAIPIKPRKE